MEVTNQTVRAVLTVVSNLTEVQAVLQEALREVQVLQEDLQVLLQEEADEGFNKNLV